MTLRVSLYRRNAAIHYPLHSLAPHGVLAGCVGLGHTVYCDLCGSTRRNGEEVSDSLSLVAPLGADQTASCLDARLCKAESFGGGRLYL